MRIGIDARCLEWQRGGPARYLINMLKLWPQMNRQHRFVLFFQNYIPDDDFLKNKLFEHILIKGPKLLKTRRIVAEQLLMPYQIKQSKLDLFFAPWYSAPLLSYSPKTVVGCWDISCNTHPSHYTILERISFGFFSPRSCRKADGVITCSQFDAHQIEQYFGIPSERICVVQFASDDKFTPASDPKQVESFRSKYGFPLRYILFMGIIIKRRNVDVIIDAFKDIYHDYPDIGLVIVGRNSTVPFVDIEAKMKPLIEEDRGFYLLRASEEDIVDFYRGAWYYICTSTTDGESLMLKEAMKCGTPVITSPLLKETVGGNAVILEDPTDRKQTADIFRRIIPDYALRNHYAAAGLQWMQPLSWNRVAQESLRFLESR
jgi:glycosyltransferase involved in cell wall biosynthesis